MRIIAGRLRGRTIHPPPGDGRPTTDRTREAIFNLIGSRMHLDGARVLDLFAGSGALGLEAVSRGAAHATFVEVHGPSCRVIRQNAVDLGVEGHCSIVRTDALRFVRRSPESFDLVLADPPYELEGLAALPDQILPLVRAEGLFVLEHGRGNAFDDHPALDAARKYGDTVVSVFRAE